MDRRAEQGGGTFTDAWGPATMQQSRRPPCPPANIHLLPLLLTQITLQGNWVDYLPSQSVITSPSTSDAVHLPVSARRQPILT